MSRATEIPVARPGWHALLKRVSAIVRRIIGAPDYASYLAHMQRCHPDREPLSEHAFGEQRLEDRYNKPGSRCC